MTISQITVGLDEYNRLKRIEREIKELTETMRVAVQQEADQGRKGHAFMLQHWTGKIRAVVDPMPDDPNVF